MMVHSRMLLIANDFGACKIYWSNKNIKKNTYDLIGKNILPSILHVVYGVVFSS